MTLTIESAAIERIEGTIVQASINGQLIRFFVTNKNDAVLRYHSDGQFYEQEELAIISHYYRHGPFIDIGAHVGNHALFAAKILGAPSVIAFEPNPHSAAILRINVAINSAHTVDTRYLGVALGGQDRRMSCITPDIDNSGHTKLFDSADGRIPCVCGDTLLQAVPVDFIKLDVEGMELEVLAGLASTIQRWRPRMFVEVWDYARSKFDLWLEAHGYRIVDTYQRYPGIVNYICLPQHDPQPAAS